MFLQLLTALSLLKVALAGFCDQAFILPSGTVSSPSFSNRSFYANNLNCQYDIRVSPGLGIKLSWSTFDIKGNMPNCYDDYVEIYIGCGTHSIGKYCSGYGAFDVPFDVYSPDNCLRIKFHSNSSGAGNGFEGHYKTFSLFSAGASDLGADCFSSESFPKTLSSTSGVISSPRWPRDYPSLRDCYWRIDVDDGKNVKIAVMDLYLEKDYPGCDNDKLKIKGGRSGDSYDRSDTIKDSMCGEKDPFYFTSDDRRIWIRFKSDSFDSERGFVVGYAMYDSKTGSGSSRTPTIGVVVGILIPIVIIACVCYVCVYRKRQARRAQQQGAQVTLPPQQMTVHPPPPPPQQGYAPPPQQGYAPPPQQGYAPPPQQGYAPPPQPGYGPPPQQGYGPPPQQGYGPPPQPGYPTQAPPPYSQVAGTPYPPPQDKSGPNPYPLGQPSGMSAYPGAAPPYPPGQPGSVPPYPPGQPEGVPPYPPEQPPGGVLPSAPPTATAPPYPPQ